MIFLLILERQTPVNTYGPDSTPDSTNNGVTYIWDGEKWDQAMKVPRAVAIGSGMMTIISFIQYKLVTKLLSTLVILQILVMPNIRVACIDDETHYWGGNLRGLQLRESQTSRYEGDTTTLYKGTADGQFKS